MWTGTASLQRKRKGKRDKRRKKDAYWYRIGCLGSLTHDAVDSLGEVIQVICVQTSHGDTAVLSLESN